MKKKNFSYTYLLPLLATTVYFNRQILTCVKNTYMFSNRHVGVFCLILVCNFSEVPDFAKLEERMISSSNFLESKDIEDDTAYIFQFPERFNAEYKHFLNGKYSKFSLIAKKQILGFWAELYGNLPTFVHNSLLKMKQILFKDNKLRIKMEETFDVTINENSELGEHIDFEEEMYSFPNQD